MNWLTLTDAAAALGVSERTLQRRIKAGKVENRIGADGRREVRLEQPDGGDSVSDSMTDNVSDTLALVKEGADRQVSIAGVLANTYRDDLRAARRSHRTAWSIVGALVLAGGVATWWTTDTVADRDAQIAVGEGRAVSLAVRLSDVQGRLRDKAEDVSRAVARAAENRAKLDEERDRFTQERNRLQDELMEVRETLVGLEVELRFMVEGYGLPVTGSGTSEGQDGDKAKNGP